MSYLGKVPVSTSDLREIVRQVFKLGFAENQIRPENKKRPQGELTVYHPSDNVIAVFASIMEQIMSDVMDAPVFEGHKGHRLVDKRELMALRNIESVLRSVFPQSLPGSSLPTGTIRLSSESLDELKDSLDIIAAARGTGVDLAEQESMAVEAMLKDRERLEP